MRDLKKESGLSVYLKDDFKLDLDIKLLGGEFSARTISDMTKVIKDKIKINNDPLYYVYRDVRERIDDEKIKSIGLRYDITVILPKMLGSEFNKTYGHYHPLKDETDLTYPEVYEVISGTALCLLQKMGKNEDELDEIYLVEVKSGEKIIMPPNFGHITINPLLVPLVMSNWVAAEFSSEYELYEKYHGGGYYLVADDKAEGYKAIKNKSYKKVSKLIKAKPKELKQFGLNFGQPLYSSGSKNIGKLNFLVNPEKFSGSISPQSAFVFE
jgi:glucose-6-phosphate isomerase